LRGANAKFERRFAHIESRLAERGQTTEGSLDEMERLRAEAKAGERAAELECGASSRGAKRRGDPEAVGRAR
jgi:nucleoside triphosphate diphosphatase